jgi:hypothetical protein
LFLDYQDDWRGNDPKSLHYKFKNAHDSVLKAKENLRSVEETQEYVFEVNHFCSNFLEMLTTDFLKRAASLQLLEVPEPGVRRERQVVHGGGELHGHGGPFE